MTKNRIGIVLSVITVSTLMLGCGSSSATPTAPTTGTVIDDYISGAKVCADVNGNGKADDGNANCVVTDAQGGFNFGVVRTEPLVMSGGTDIGTGKAFKGTFTAPSGSKVINPLTTIVQAVVASGKSVADAQTVVRANLGLDPAIDLTTYDPIAEVTFGADTVAKETARTVLAQQTNIQVILSTVATTIAAASTTDTVDESAVTEQAATQIAALITATPTATINSKASVTKILTNTATKLVASTPINDTVIAAVSQQVEATAQLVVQNIKAVVVSGDNQATETGIEAITAANRVLAFVTDTDNADSVVNTIQAAVAGDVTATDTLSTATIDNTVLAQVTIPTRPTVTPPSDTTLPVVTPTTGGEGGN